jgi:glycosyltransferase involved in cell wall biosynthesis
MKKLTVLIPCYNEEKGIGAVIDNIPFETLLKLGISTEVLVIDNNSKDHTAQVARSKGARVVHEKNQGKGNALRTGFRSISDDTDFVVMLDGDNTYKSSEIVRMIEPLNSGFCDVVIGSRLGGRMHSGTMTKFNRLGNWLFTFLVRYFYHGNITDVCTGYFAWKREVVQELVLHLNSSGYSIEMEMVTKMAKLGYSIYSVPITYDYRAGESALSPFRDGIKIINTWRTNLFWKPTKVTKAQKKTASLTANNFVNKQHTTNVTENETPTQATNETLKRPILAE